VSAGVRELVYVAAARRGTGVADALLTEAERRVAEGGHQQAWLAVVAENARARRFYQARPGPAKGALDWVAVGAGTADL
jgi:ribosomal protein S18 acetylase RimI-like enzyme